MKTKMKQRVQAWLNDHTPVGMNGRMLLNCITGSILTAFSFHLAGFMIYYDYCLGALYKDDARTMLYDPTGKDSRFYMPSFAEMMDSRYYLFLVAALIMAVLAVQNYRYHLQGSKSIYLMRRLPDQKDFARRCLTLPAMGILAIIFSAAILTGLCYCSYIINTPEVYLK